MGKSYFDFKINKNLSNIISVQSSIIPTFIYLITNLAN